MKRILSFFLVLPFALQLHGQIIHTFAGNGYGAATGSGGYTGDNGLAIHAELYACTGVTFDGAGNVYIADRNNNVIRKVNTSGIISTFAGTGTAGYSGDNGPATAARLDRPYGVASDASGNVYIADYGNNVIRKVNTFGVITTYAGAGIAGYSGDLAAATAAQLTSPTGVAIDTMGNLFIADAGNNVVREVFASGIIGTIAGTGVAGYSGDGSFAVGAKLSYPVSIAVDPFDQVYIADYNNSVVRKVDTNGMITTFAGNGTVGHAGDGTPATTAQLRFPAGVAVFGFGNVYIADEGNNEIRMVNSAGIISTYAGKYSNGYSGDGGLAVNAQLSSPKGIAADGMNRLYIADFDNNVIRIVETNDAVRNISITPDNFKVYPNPSSGSFTVELPATRAQVTIIITDMLGRTVATEDAAPSGVMQQISVGGLNPGAYIITVNSGASVYHQQVQVR